MNREFMHSLDVKCEAVDVLVVGAGPAGTTAAKVLAGKGFRVLLAERCKLPRYKSCSGAARFGYLFAGRKPGDGFYR